jgi:hypothetical protein
VLFWFAISFRSIDCWLPVCMYSCDITFVCHF